MPIYEFVCESCGRLVERLQKVSDPPPEGCPECGGKMAKIMSRNSFQLKGGGWYRDLYSSSGSKSGDAAGAAPSNSSAAGAASPTKEAATPQTSSTPASPSPKKE